MTKTVKFDTIASWSLTIKDDYWKEKKMDSRRIIHDVDVDDFVSRIRNGAELLKDISSQEEVEDIMDGAEILLFRRALKGDKVSHDALYLLNPERAEKVHHVLERFDTALEVFEEAAPDLVGSIPAEVTQSSIRKLFFALLGVNCEESAFKLLEHVWQYFSWNAPKSKIPAGAFQSVFSLLMASGNSTDAFGLLNDAQNSIDWNDSNQQGTAVESAMQIFSIFLSLGKYALARRIITAMKPLVDYQRFLEDLEDEARENSERENVSQVTQVTTAVQEAQEEVLESQEDQSLPKIQELPSSVLETEITTAKEQEKENPSPVLPKEPLQDPDIPSMLAAAVTTEQQENNPFVLALVKAYGIPVPQAHVKSKKIMELSEYECSLPSGNPDFPYNFQLPIGDSEDSPWGIVYGLNDRLHEMLLTLVKTDGVRCLRDIPLTVGEFQRKFPRYSDEQYARQITPIVIKVKMALESTEPYQYQEKKNTPVKTGKSGSPKDKNPVDLKKSKTTSFFQRAKKKRASR